MARTILAPFDGSVLAAGALPYAASLAGAGGKLVLLRVVDDPAAVMTSRRALRQRARRLHRRLPSIEILAQVEVGETAAVTAATAATLPADAIVLSTHGEGGAARWLYGATAAAILRRTPVPVLLVPSGSVCDWPVGGPIRILVPLDGSGFALEAVEAVLTLFAGAAIQVLLVRAVEPLGAASGRPGCQYMWHSTEQAVIEAERYLARERRALRAAGVTVETRVLRGAPATAVAAAACESRVDLIAAATHGNGGIAGTITGSTMARIFQHTHGPVLLVRPAWIRHTIPAPATPPYADAEIEDLPVTVGFTPIELDYVRRGLERLLGEVRSDEPVYRLLARVRRARAAHETERERRGTAAA